MSPILHPFHHLSFWLQGFVKSVAGLQRSFLYDLSFRQNSVSEMWKEIFLYFFSYWLSFPFDDNNKNRAVFHTGRFYFKAFKIA